MKTKKIIKEYEGNKYYVFVDPRFHKIGQDIGFDPDRDSNGRLVGFHPTRGDCVIRALALATGKPYINVAKKLHVKLDAHNDVPKNFDGMHWEDVFKYFNKSQPKLEQLQLTLQMTVKDFARTISRHVNFKDRYLVVACCDEDFEYAHAVFVKNGRYYDTWDSGDWIVTEVYDVTEERGLNASDFRNVVQIRRGTKKRYKKQKPS